MRNSLKHIKRVLLMGLVAFSAVSCTREDIGGDTSGVPDSKVRLSFSIDAPDYSTPVTRAAESTVGNTPMVLVFTGNDETAVFFEAAQATHDGTKTTVTVSKSDDQSIFVVIAHAPDKFLSGGTEYDFTAANLNMVLDHATVSDLESKIRTLNLGLPQTSLPYAGSTATLPMAGLSAPVPKIDETTKIENGNDKMALTRAVANAYVTVDGSLTNFNYLGAGLIHVARNGAIYRDGGNQNIDDTYDTTHYLASNGGEVITGAGTHANPFYIYETVKNDSKQPAIIIKAALGGNQYYYKLGFVKDKEYLDILRNHCYIFNIEEISPGYTSIDEAIDGPVSNIRYTIRVVDDTAHDLVSNGQYYLGVSNSEVLNYGRRTSFTDAFVVTTDYKSEWGSDKITLTPSPGITINTPSSGTIDISSGITSQSVSFTASVAMLYGTIEVRIDNLVQTITFRRRTLLPFTGYGSLPYSDYVQWDIPPGTGDWLKLKGEDNQRHSGNKTFRKGQRVYIDADNYTTDNGTREATFLVSRSAGSRTRVYVTQQGVDMNTVAHWMPDGGYVGAFWRASQTGERLIRIPYNDEIVGEWTATVVAGGEWIKLDMEPTSDEGVTWNAGAENPADMMTDDALYQVPGDGLSVGGTVEAPGDMIYFRIGLKSTIPKDSQPRYGVILMAYNRVQNSNGAISEKYCYLYLRQGEQPDYVFGPKDPNAANGGWGNGVIHRPYAVRFSPFNLTAREYKDNHKYLANASSGKTNTNHPQIIDRGEFVEYPTQAGALFNYASAVNKKRAWHPIFPSGSNTQFFPNAQWPADNADYFGSSNWDAIKDEHESCPEGYRRMRDHNNDAVAGSNTVAPSDSEIRQSLFITPPSSNGSAGNSNAAVCFYGGFYADGFFDRRGLVMDSSTFNPTNAVAADGTSVAYRGTLFYNRFNNASVFFPSSGIRIDRGTASTMGKAGHYWTSSSPASNFRAWYIQMSVNTSYGNGASVSMGYSYRHQAYAIRCVVDEDYYSGN